jgi:hypothetical protein
MQDPLALDLIPLSNDNIPVCPTKQREPEILKCRFLNIVEFLIQSREDIEGPYSYYASSLSLPCPPLRFPDAMPWRHFKTTVLPI